jgi:hypothetical protein
MSLTGTKKSAVISLAISRSFTRIVKQQWSLLVEISIRGEFWLHTSKNVLATICWLAFIEGQYSLHTLENLLATICWLAFIEGQFSLIGAYLRPSESFVRGTL